MVVCNNHPSSQATTQNMSKVCLVMNDKEIKEMCIPEEYDKDFVGMMLNVLTDSLGKLPFKLYVKDVDKSNYILTPGPFETAFGLDEWSKLVELAKSCPFGVVMVYVELYTTAEQVNHAIRTSCSPTLAFSMWQTWLSVDDALRPDCVRGLACNLKDEVFALGLNYLHENCMCVQERASFVLDALDELGPAQLKPEWFDTILAAPYGLYSSLDFMLNLLTKIAGLAELANKKPTAKPFCHILEDIVNKTDLKVFTDMNFLPKLAELNPRVALRNLQVDFGVSYFDTEAVFRSAMRSGFATPMFHQQFIFKISELLELSNARLCFLQSEVEHNMKLCGLMKPQLLKRLMTPDFVARNMDNPDCPVELSATWDVRDKAFDKLIVHNAVWLDLQRFTKAPEVVQVDANLALAALQHKAVEPSRIPAQLWASHAFVSKCVEFIDPYLARFATRMTPVLAASALHAASQRMSFLDQVSVFFELVLAAFSACKDDVHVAQACLLLCDKSLRKEWRRAFRACNAKTIALDWHETVRTSRLVACRFALHVDLACASSSVFANFHGDKDFVTTCIVNLGMDCSNFDVQAFERCLGNLRDDRDVLVCLLVNLGGGACKIVHLFSESIQANQVVKALLKRL